MAGPSADEIAAFEACVSEAYAENIENFTASMGVPVICGARHIPKEQSCNFFGQLTDPVGCLEKDHAYWKTVLETNLEVYGVDKIVDNSLLDSGLKRCKADEEEGVARTGCELEVLWRDAVITRALPIMDAINQAAE